VETALKAVWNEGDDALVEDFIAGREFTVSIVEHAGGTMALEPVEIIKNPHQIFDYHNKYNTESQTQEICPAVITSEQRRQLQDLALIMHRALGCKHVSRTDIIMTNDDYVFLETNTIPGMTDRSLLPLAARESGISLQQLLNEWLENL
jgi:D-alanine-D-alanine ligase